MEKIIKIPEWQFKHIENALRLTHRINKCASEETAFDREVVKAYGFATAAMENVDTSESGLHLHSVTGSFNLNIIRQWFDAVEDLNPGYLQKSDYKLAKVIYEKLDFPIPKSISSNCR